VARIKKGVLQLCLKKYNSCLERAPVKLFSFLTGGEISGSITQSGPMNVAECVHGGLR
jgi:hypothetical protein